MTKTPISACVICFNEERNIERCLKSLTFCDEIILVDSGSTDSTLNMAKKYTDKIFTRDWSGYREQKQFALEQCSNKWILSIDSDEEISETLKLEIQSLKLETPINNPPKVAGYSVPRVVYFMNKWWKKGGWYPEYRLRLMYKDLSYWGGVDPHDKAIVKGTIKKITKGNIKHYTYANLKEQIQALNNHSSVSANNLFALNKKVGLRHLIINPISRFIKFFIIKKGFLEGIEGFLVAVNEAHYVFLKYAKIWELQKNSKKN